MTGFVGARMFVTLVALVVLATGCTSALPPPTSAPHKDPAAQDTSSTRELTPPPQPIIVSAAYVRDLGENLIVGQPITVSGHALAEAGMSTLELWAGTELVAAEQADRSRPSPALYARWQWQPVESGPVPVFVRAIDLLGRVAQSNAVRVEVDASIVVPQGREARNAIAVAGNGVVADFGLGPQQIDVGATAPQIRATLIGCMLDLAVTEAPASTNGISVYGLAPSGSNFTRVLTVAAASTEGQQVALEGGGSYLFSASAFDDSVEMYGPPIEVEAPPECNRGGWSGDVSLVDGVLQAPREVERAYLYLTEGDGAAVRVPADEGAFVQRNKADVLDFSHVWPAVGDSAFEIEAWGWQAGSLVRLGSGAYTPPPPTTVGPDGGGATAFGGPQLSGASLTSLHVLQPGFHPGPDPCLAEFCWYEEPLLASTIERPPVGSTKPLETKFRWKTTLGSVSQFIWQVLPYPPANSPDLAPPFLIDHGAIAVSAGQAEGEFTIDFNEYFQAGVPVVGTDAPVAETLVMGPLFGSPGGTSPTPTPGGGGSSGEATVDDIDPLQLTTFSDRFYVRLIPIVFNAAMLPSNHVALDIVEPSAPIQIVNPNAGEGTNKNAYTLQWSYTAPVGPDGKYARCALVTAIDPAYSPTAPLYPTYKSYLDSGQPICYEPPSGGGWSAFDVFDAFVEFVGDVWDYVADGYDWIKKKVVEAVLVAVPCTKIASQAVCEQIATTALEAALASFGIPPSLPKFDAAVAAAKGDLATLVVESASSIPGVSDACGLAQAGNTVSDKVKTCEELAALAIDEIVEEMNKARSEAAGTAAGFYHPLVTFVPDPRGQFQPPSFKVTLTRTNDPSLPKTCSVQVYMESLKKSWTFPELHQGYPKPVTADVSGEPFLRTSMIVKPLAPGQSMTRQLWLTQPRTWFESLRAQWYWHYFEAMPDDYSRAWVLLTGGSELTFGVESNCAPSSEQGPYVLPASAYGV